MVVVKKHRVKREVASGLKISMRETTCHGNEDQKERNLDGSSNVFLLF